VVVAPRSLSNANVILILIGWLFLSWLSPAALAEEQPAGYLARIEAHTTEELQDILSRAEEYMSRQHRFSQTRPIALVLHGEEVKAFLRENYVSNKELVDLAAKLDAFNVIDIQVCEVWMSLNQVDRDQLPAFINTVPYGPREEKRLQGSGYIFF
jgi:intracellular sulfur oxidation DsrE/DsrF family protein